MPYRKVHLPRGRHISLVVLLILVSAASLMVAIGGFAYSVVNITQDLYRIQASRRTNTEDVCHILRNLVFVAYGNDKKDAHAVIHRTGLANCRHTSYVATYRGGK